MALSKTMEDLTLGSDAENGNFCAPCALDGEYRLIVKFCLDCCQPICQPCVDSHRRIKQIQGHKLIDKINKDSLKHAETLSSCLACPNHAHKTIEFICVDHDMFCCSTCATANHRSCRQVKDVAEIAQRSADVTASIKHLADAKAHLGELINFRQEENSIIQDQVSRIIPTQIKKMKASVMETFDELEKRLLREARKTADIKVKDGIIEIAKWQSHIETVNNGNDLLSVAQENGTVVHKYIAAKNIEEKLAEIDNAICHARAQLKSEHLSFSFDKGMLLRNAHVVLNNVTKSLAEIDDQGLPQKQQTTHFQNQLGFSPSDFRRKGAATISSQFAKLSVVTSKVKPPDYSYGQPKSGALHNPQGFSGW